MFTKCPECQKIHPLTLEQLRASRGILRCEACSETFDALELISETAAYETAASLPATDLPWNQENTPGGAYWSVGLIIGLLLLAGQIVYFEGYYFSQNPIFRPVLEKICTQLNCRLPAYKNLDEFTVLQGSLSALPDHTHLFRAVISNQAAFTQIYPNITLTLLDYTGKPFTHRVFRPQEYLPKDSITTPAMISDATTEINLNIAAPEAKVGGYTFELIY
jgi:predicted Zn finger-like uncharacterized protein